MSSATMDATIDQLRGLPLEKRLEIIEALWESVEDEAGLFPISDEIADEADREYEAHLADPSSSIPWEQVRARIRRRLGHSLTEPHSREVGLSESEQGEFDRRLAEHRRNPAAAKPVDAFLDELDRRYA